MCELKLRLAQRVLDRVFGILKIENHLMNKQASQRHANIILLSLPILQSLSILQPLSILLILSTLLILQTLSTLQTLSILQTLSTLLTVQ